MGGESAVLVRGHGDVPCPVRPYRTVVSGDELKFTATRPAFMRVAGVGGIVDSVD